ncbi:MAG: nitrate reductase cytochrome c-type subunit [Burkholderiales bacterium]|jgi:nitrate reductase cytochrome c-type subunit|nr:nitrate reductase cytochrome c-type subunit [Burkholderiales bacterium]
MKRVGLGILAAAFLVACAGMSIDDKDFGLSKGSVFDASTPQAFSYEGAGTGKAAPTPLGTPPVITHPIESYPPITASANACTGCHAQPANIGKPKAQGEPTAAPADHYVKGADGKLAMSGAHWNCLLCHAPQAGVPPLVGTK